LAVDEAERLSFLLLTQKAPVSNHGTETASRGFSQSSPPPPKEKILVHYCKICHDHSVHVARIAVKRNAYRVLVGKTRMKSHLEYINVDGRIILKLILYDRKMSTGFIWLRIGISDGLM
jgi:hypothetical protein